MESATARADVHVIQPASRWPSVGLRELVRYRELIFFLAWRDLKVRYKQTVLGVGWAVLQPVLWALILSFIFGRYAGFYDEGKPYFLLTLSALVLWQAFANAITFASNSLVGNASLITKVYFPRLAAPIAPVLAAVVDLLIASSVLLVAMAAYGTFPAPNRIWTAIPAVGLALCLAVGIGAWLAAANVKYRDIRFVVPFLLQIWMFVSPVAYSPLLIKEPWYTIYHLNPMAAAIEAFRWAFLGGVPPSFAGMALSAVVAIVFTVVGVVYFRRTEREFADLV
jgi:lipopolysaccharide transport system permease protein